MKRLIWIGVAALLLGAVLFSLRTQPVEVEIGPPRIQTVFEYITEEAKTRLAQEYLIDMPVAGTLERIPREVGDEVAAGDVLARVDRFDLEQQTRGVESHIAQVQAQISGVDIGKPKSEDLESAAVRVQELGETVGIAEKELAIAEIEAGNADRDRSRMRQLRAEGVASQAELDRAERLARSAAQNVDRARLGVKVAQKNLEMAHLAKSRVTGSVDDNEYMRRAYQAEMESLDAQLAIVRGDLEKTEVRAPVAGPILEKYVESRRVLPPGTPLLKMGDLSSVEIESDILSEEVVRVQPGQRVEISGKAVGRETSFEGTVKRIYPSAFMKISALGIEQQRVKTIIAFDNSTLGLRPGTRLDVRIITAEKQNAVSVPERSIFRREGKWYVFTVQSGRARLAPVSIGLKNDEWAEITDGLTAGDVIILEPKNDLENGVRIKSKG